MRGIRYARALRRAARAAVAALGVSIAAAGVARACSTALVLAIDVSSSVDTEEYRLQTAGLANAFRAPEVTGAILGGGGIMATVVYWSGYPHQETRILWTPLRTETEIEAFAQRLETIARRYAEFPTAIGKALQYLEPAFVPETAHCRRRVIDISGDGTNNSGPEPEAFRDRLVANGVTINALVIKDKQDFAHPPIVERHYEQSVIGGPGAFIEVAVGFEDYERAMRRKLFRELAPRLAAR